MLKYTDSIKYFHFVKFLTFNEFQSWCPVLSSSLKVGMRSCPQKQKNKGVTDIMSSMLHITKFYCK